MAEHNDIGKKGEDVAANFLSKNGYYILERNWHYNKAEIDIIARIDDFIAFVEVKTRKTNYFGEPEEFVSKKKQKLIIKAANEYIISKNIEHEARFDIISILYNEKDYKINHIIEAFYPLV